jgi:hypothetical protein
VPPLLLGCVAAPLSLAFLMALGNHLSSGPTCQAHSWSLLEQHTSTLICSFLQLFFIPHHHLPEQLRCFHDVASVETTPCSSFLLFCFLCLPKPSFAEKKPFFRFQLTRRRLKSIVLCLPGPAHISPHQDLPFPKSSAPPQSTRSSQNRDLGPHPMQME